MKVIGRDLGMSFSDAGNAIEIFSGVNFEVASGASTAIVGESGVGKTTLLNLVGGLERPTTGSVQLGDLRLDTLRERPAELARFRGQNIGIIFQFHHLLPEFTAVENVAMPLLFAGIKWAEARTRAQDLLTRVGLGQRFEHRPGMLSGGEQQRVAIARALSGKPGLVLADEPTGNLDIKTAKEVHELLVDMQQEEGVTLIVVTHSLELANRLQYIVELTPRGIVPRAPLSEEFRS